MSRPSRRPRSSLRQTVRTAKAKAILVESLHHKRSDNWAQVDAIYERLAASGRTFTDSADLLREDRNR